MTEQAPWYGRWWGLTALIGGGLIVLVGIPLALILTFSGDSTSDLPGLEPLVESPASGVTGDASATGDASGAPAAGAQTFTNSNWAAVNAAPDTYVGAAADIVVKVTVDPERDDQSTYIRADAGQGGAAWITIISLADPKLKVKEDDTVRVKGTILGGFEGKDADGSDITGVNIVADTVEPEKK